ncbi:murein hydrolase activator EnvC family protein [Pseudomonadota bacterium]
MILLIFGKSSLSKLAKSLSCLLILTPLWIQAAENPSIKQEQLGKLREKISSLKVDLEAVRNERDSRRQGLQVTEARIAEVDRSILQTSKQLKNNKVKLRGLQKRRRTTLGKLEQQRMQFSKLVRATYMMGHQDYTKMLLSQKDPSKFSRAMEYYKYLARMRVNQIQVFSNALDELERLEKEITQKSAELATLTEIQTSNRQSLQSYYSERELAVKKLAEEIHSKSQQIESLGEDEQRLLKLIEQIKQFTAQQKISVEPVKSFGSMKGKLSLPLDAKIISHFGDIQQPSGVKWQGLLMAAPQDKPIEAVFNGRVIFADRFRGFGLLLILDHGDGYMSLYSHNKLLFKQLGDWVNSGETIATVGNSGGLAKPGLYFEIRHNGVPRDPLIWCAG